jgi:hypothetical protein
MQEVTDEQIKEQIAITFAENPELKRCINCYHRDRDKKFCPIIGKPAPDYMYGCRHHVTNEAYVIQQTRKRMQEDAEREKQEDGEQNWRLTLSLDCLNAGLRFLYDFESHAKAHYERALKRGFNDDARFHKRESKCMKDMAFNYKKMMAGIEQARKYYDLYIMPQLTRVFTDENGAFCERSYTDHESDGCSVAHIVAEWADKTSGNMANRESIDKFLSELKGAGIFSEQSKNHYKFKG